MTKQRWKTMAKPRISSPETEEKYRICLEGFQNWLEKNNKSPNTIRVYLAAMRQYFELYPSVNPENLMLYKCYLIDHYKTRTVNQRIRAINSYVEFLDLPYSRLFMIRQQQKPFLENVISQADYEYLIACLLRDRKMPYYFAVRTMATTGMRVSELVRLRVEDVRRGYVDLRSKGNRIRRVFIPKAIRLPCLNWLNSIGRSSGYVFLNRLGSQITVSGIRDQLKHFADIYNLNASVVYPHSFRHLFAKNFIERCGDIAMLSDILGHESIETTRIYLQRSSAEQQQIFNKIVDW